MKIKTNTVVLLTALILLFMSSCRSEMKKVSFSGKAQGTFYNITYYDEHGRNLQSEIDSILDEFNFTASMYEPNSILSKLNNNDTTVVLNNDFVKIFNIAAEVSGKTDGAFDITVAPLVNAWGFGLKNKEKIDSSYIDSILPYVNYKYVKIENNVFVKKYSEIKIDFNAIAQGYSVDLVAMFLESKAISDYIVEIGGEIRAGGRKPGNLFWTAGIDKPTDNIGSEHIIQAKVKLDNMSVATSGNYRKFYVENGVKYSHTINPGTGYPVTHSLLSASVFAENCAVADAYATAFMVMGFDKTKAFLDSNPDIEAYLIFDGGKGEMKTFMTKGLTELLTEEVSD